MKKIIFFLLFFVCVGVALWWWNDRAIRLVQANAGIPGEKTRFLDLVLTVPPDWVLLYSRGTGAWYDGKLFGLVPTDRFDAMPDKSLMLFAVGEERKEVFGFFPMSEMNAGHWVNEEQGCTKLMAHDKSIRSCQNVKWGRLAAVEVTTDSSFGVYIPSRKVKFGTSSGRKVDLASIVR